jgi:hypothetical protein
MPLEFGHKVFLAESAQGLITQYEVLKGNPSDEDHVGPSLKRHKDAFGTAPEIYGSDRPLHQPYLIHATHSPRSHWSRNRWLVPLRNQAQYFARNTKFLGFAVRIGKRTNALVLQADIRCSGRRLSIRVKVRKLALASSTSRFG